MTIQAIPSGTNRSTWALAAINSETIDTDNKGLKVGTLSFQVNSTGFNQATATVKLQHSNDNTNWNDVTDGSLTIASGTASAVLTPVVSLAMRYYRVVYTPNTNTAGTIQVLVNLL
jgi:hypothetical protein